MFHSLARFTAFALSLLLIGGGAAAAAEPSAALQSRAQQLVGLFNGSVQPADVFADSFLAKVPAAQVAGISRQVTADIGRATRVGRIDAQSATAATVVLEFEKGTAQLNIALEPAAPHRVVGLLITGTQKKGDSLAVIAEELGALPGQTSLAVARLGEGGPRMLVAKDADKPLAIGSTFKLFVLAELARSIRAGERKWSDTVPLSNRSLPSGILQDWPTGSPITLHTLASLMISISDNSATDTLLHALGREKVEALLPTLGIAQPERNRPFLSTLEAFVLKGGDPALQSRWLAANEAQRRELLAANKTSIDPEKVVPVRLSGAPNRIDSIEWFASASDLVKTLDWIRRSGDQSALGILAINPGLGTATTGFPFAGYKGGSEPGVLNMSFLLRGSDGGWHVVTGSWNNGAAALDEARFTMLMGRAVALLRVAPAAP